MVLKEYLVRLGLQDNMTRDLKKNLGRATKDINDHSISWGKAAMKAGTIVTTSLVAAGFALGKFINNLSKSDDELGKFAADMGMTREEAFKTKSALDVMGKSMDEIAASPALLKQFEELRANAESIKLPDLSEGLESVRGVTTEFLKLKQTAMAGLQWVGHYLFKYIDRPLQDIRKTLGGLNEFLGKNITAWADKIGQALSWIVRLGATLIRGAGAVFGAIKRIFDMIPDGVKIATAALAGLMMFIKMGPIGKLITILTVALMILEDFFTWLDGGESLLGPVWQLLADLFSGFTGSGEGALAFFSGEFLPGLLGAISKVFPIIAETILSYAEPVIGFAVQVIEGIVKVITDNLPRLVQVLGGIVDTILDLLLKLLPMLIDMGARLLTSIISGIVDMVPRLAEAAIGVVDRLLSTLVGALPQLLEAGVRLVLALVDGLVQALPVIIKAIVDIVGSLIRIISENLPMIIQAGIDMLLALIEGIVEALPELIDAILGIIPLVVEMLLDNLPLILNAGIKILLSLVDGLVRMIPRLINAAIDLVIKIIDTIVRMLPDIIQMGIQLVMSLILGIVDALPAIILSIVNLVTSVVAAIVDNLPRIIDSGIQMVLALINGIIEALPQLIQAVMDLIPMIVQTIVDLLPQLIEAGIQLVISLVGGIVDAIPQLVAAVPQIVGALLNGLASLPGMLLDLGKTLISSLWDGISSMGSWIKDRVGGFASGIWDGLKGIFGGGGGSSSGHAEGVVSTAEHDARISEGDQPEAVIPLSKPGRARQMLKQAANFIGMGGDSLGGDGGGGKATAMFDKMQTFIDQAAAAMHSMGQMATAGAAAGAAGGSSSVADNREIDASTTYNIYGSGDPQATAQAIDRMQELRTRNMKGVIQ